MSGRLSAHLRCTGMRHLGVSPRRMLGLGVKTLVVSLTGAILFSPVAGLAKPRVPTQELPAPVAYSSVSWAITPSNDRGEVDRGSVHHAVEPGGSFSDFVTLSNFSTTPLTFSLRILSAVTGADGGLTWESGQGSDDAGSWVRIGSPADSIRIEPGQRITVPYGMDVPADASVGDHPVAIEATVLEPRSDLGTVPTSQVLRINSRVSGQALPAIEVRDVEPRYVRSANPLAPGKVDVSYTVVNTGNIAIRGAVCADAVGLYSQVFPEHGDGTETIELLPGAVFSGRVTVPDIWPLVRFDARVAFVPQQASGYPVGTSGGSVVGGNVVWAVPFTHLLCAGVLAILLVGGWLTVGTRSRYPRKIHS